MAARYRWNRTDWGLELYDHASQPPISVGAVCWVGCNPGGLNGWAGEANSQRAPFDRQRDAKAWVLSKVEEAGR